MEIPKTKIKLKDKEFEIDFTSELEQFNKDIFSILEKEYKKKLKYTNNLYRLIYFDEDNDKIFIKTQEDYNYFVNISNEVIVEVDENLISQNSEKEPESSNNMNEKNLLEKIEKLSRINEELKKKNDLYDEMNKIYLEKISLLEEDKKIKNEKTEFIMKTLKDEQKQKNELMDQLKEANKLNESISMANNLSLIQNDEDNSKDILVNNLKEEKTMLEQQLTEQKKMIENIEKNYNEDKNRLKKKLSQLENEFDSHKQKILINNEELIKNEIDKGINDYINKSKINNNEINKIKNDYENKINSIREECYQEMEEKFSKIYEEKLKEIYESALNNSKAAYDNVISKNKEQFEQEEKKRNDIINSNLLMRSNVNSSTLSRLSQCKTVHKNIECDECKMFPIKGYRYKCLECPKYNLCDQCEKIVSHEHNLLRYVNEENIVFKNDKKFSYECLDSLSTSINEGSKEAVLKFTIKNNGYTQWTKNTFLINGKDSKFSCNHIQLKPLKPNEEEVVEIKYENLQTIRASIYYCYLLFSVDDKAYGQPLKIEVIIVKN